MAVVDFKELKAHLGPKQRLLGLDHGTRRIGVAVCDDSLKIATPVETIAYTKFTAAVARIAVLIKEFNIAGLVIGLPLNMDGSEGPRCQSVRHFGDNLLGVLEDDIAIAFVDERLTSDAAHGLISGNKRARDKDAVDQLAAVQILQSVLNSAK